MLSEYGAKIIKKTTPGFVKQGPGNTNKHAPLK